jgi:hypothetical protein
VSDLESRTGASVPMTRREALMKAATALMGALAVPGLLAGCAPDGRDTASASRASAQDDQALLEDIADTLLPDTAASPGAKSAGVGATMALLLADCRTPDVQQRVTAGLRAFRATCRAAGGSFESLPRADRERLLRETDAAARLAGDAHWYSTVRELALTSYFTSEVGMTRATRYVPIPGRYQGCVPLAPGQPAWG